MSLFHGQKVLNVWHLSHLYIAIIDINQTGVFKVKCQREPLK